MFIFHSDLEFTRDGRIFDEQQAAALLARLDQVTDLLIVSHGWNNDRAEASALYDRLTQSLTEVKEANLVPGLSDRQIGMLRLFWPSKRFADADLIPGGGAASATGENHEALLRLLEEMKHNPLRLGEVELDPVRAATLSQAEALVPRLDEDPAARAQFVQLLRTILDPSEAHGDDGSEEFFTLDPEELFAGLADPVVAPGAPQGGGGAAIGHGGAAGLGDFLGGVGAAARRLANYSTYYEMKQRAGVVGRTGLATMLQRLRDRAPQLRLHLVGHSFGARLVTAAAHTLPPNTTGVSLSLLQAAFSHNAFAAAFDDTGRPGAFRALVAERRASGPVVITHTKNDQAVGIAYPLASRLARDPAQAVGDENDPYGGLGRNGALHTDEVQAGGQLEDLGHVYGFESGRIYNLRADAFVTNHGDVAGHQVAQAMLNAIAAVD